MRGLVAGLAAGAKCGCSAFQLKYEKDTSFSGSESGGSLSDAQIRPRCWVGNDLIVEFSQISVDKGQQPVNRNMVGITALSQELFHLVSASLDVAALGTMCSTNHELNENFMRLSRSRQTALRGQLVKGASAWIHVPPGKCTDAEMSKRGVLTEFIMSFKSLNSFCFKNPRAWLDMWGIDGSQLHGVIHIEDNELRIRSIE